MKTLLVIVFSTIFFGGNFTKCFGPNQTDLDQQVLDQLKNAGSNLEKPHNIEFFLYFPTEQAAKNAADEVNEEGCETKVEFGTDSTTWLCFATKEMIPKHSELVDLRKRFNEIAGQFKGEYDGWGTKIVP